MFDFDFIDAHCMLGVYQNCVTKIKALSALDNLARGVNFCSDPEVVQGWMQSLNFSYHGYNWKTFLSMLNNLQLVNLQMAMLLRNQLFQRKFHPKMTSVTYFFYLLLSVDFSLMLILTLCFT